MKIKCTIILLLIIFVEINANAQSDNNKMAPLKKGILSNEWRNISVKEAKNTKPAQARRQPFSSLPKTISISIIEKYLRKAARPCLLCRI